MTTVATSVERPSRRRLTATRWRSPLRSSPATDSELWTTNLPDGTEVEVVANWPYEDPTGEVYIGTLVPPGTTQGGVDAVVRNSSFDVTLMLSYGALLINVDPIAVLSDTAIVCAQVLTGPDPFEEDALRQPERVRAVIGDYGEGLVGATGAFEFGSAT